MTVSSAPILKVGSVRVIDQLTLLFVSVCRVWVMPAGQSLPVRVTPSTLVRSEFHQASSRAYLPVATTSAGLSGQATGVAYTLGVGVGVLPFFITWTSSTDGGALLAVASSPLNMKIRAKTAMTARALRPRAAILGLRILLAGLKS